MSKTKRMFLSLASVGFLMGSMGYSMAEEKAPVKSDKSEKTGTPAKKQEGKDTKGDKGNQKEKPKEEKEPYIF